MSCSVYQHNLSLAWVPLVCFCFHLSLKGKGRMGGTTKKPKQKKKKNHLFQQVLISSFSSLLKQIFIKPMSVFPWLISSADNKLVSWSYHASMSLLTGLITQWMGICFL